MNIIELNIATSGIWIRIFGRGINIRYFKKRTFFLRNKKHFRIWKVYFYFLEKY